jgi:hypothetical protein
MALSKGARLKMTLIVATLSRVGAGNGVQRLGFSTRSPASLAINLYLLTNSEQVISCPEKIALFSFL